MCVWKNEGLSRSEYSLWGALAAGADQVRPFKAEPWSLLG